MKTLKVNDKKNISWYVKLIMITIVVFGTWNPSEYNFVNYIIHMDFKNMFNYFAILLLIAIWGIFIRIVYEAMGKVGATIFLILALLFVLGMYQQGWISLENLKNTGGLIINITVVLLIFFATMIPVWWRKVTGKVATDSDME